MSYVIQNFYSWNCHFVLTPRFKFFFYLLNIEKILFFFKFNFFFFFFKKFNLYELNIFQLFFKFFFSKQWFKILFKLNLNFVGNYNNNLTKSSIFWIFKNILQFLSNVPTITCKWQLVPDDEYICNFYYYPIKITNIKITKSYYKNIFFYFMLIWPFLWYQWHNSIKFYLNFIFITYHFQTSRFYNNYFLKIYNF